MAEQSTVTALLARVDSEDPRQVMDRLVPLVYEELHEMAHRQLAQEKGARTLNTTALVHECYVKLVDGDQVPVKNRSYFFGAAARAMRQVLVDAARRRKRLKRGEGEPAESLDETSVGVDAFVAEVLDVDLALQRFAAEHPRAERVVECRYFAGLSLAETAEALQVSQRTVVREWTFARAWLSRELAETAAALPG